jgi:predicted ATPase
MTTGEIHTSKHTASSLSDSTNALAIADAAASAAASSRTMSPKMIGDCLLSTFSFYAKDMR